MRFLLFGIIITFLTSCSSIRTVEPLKKGDLNVNFDIGGPLVNFSNIPIFIPLTSLGASYGFSDNLSANANIHTTALLFSTLQLETSVNIRTFEFGKFGTSVNVGDYFFYGFRESTPSVYLFSDFNIYSHYGKKQNLVYLAFSPYFELHKTKAFNEPVNARILPNITIGNTFKFSKIDVGLELKYLNFIADNRNLVVDYISLSNKGSLGLYISFRKKF
jgi:hypothetical protein